MIKITQTPWHVEADMCEGKVFGFSIFAPESVKFPLGMRIGNVPFVAEHNQHHIVGEEDARKVAQLAAAAPALLDALIALYSITRGVPDSEYHIVTNAAAAIAKAGG